MKNKLVNKFFALIICCPLILPLPGFGQNIPVVTQDGTQGVVLQGTGTTVLTIDNSHSIQDLNYLRIVVPKRRDTTLANFSFSSDPSTSVKSVSFFDGDGNVKQSIKLAFSKQQGNFMALLEATDPRTNQSAVRYLPTPMISSGVYEGDFLFRNNEYYRMKFPSEGSTSSKNLSVLVDSNTSTANERSMTTFQPGKSTVGQLRGNKSTYIFNKVLNSFNTSDINSPSYNIKLWKLNELGIPVSLSLYNEGTLEGSKISNSDGSVKWMFVNLDGNPVLEASLVETKFSGSGGGVQQEYIYAYTYYVYDRLNRLRFILPPKAVKELSQNSWIVTDKILAELCFSYDYDSKGRVHTTHKPGELHGNGLSAATEVVYDKYGRAVLRRSPLEYQKAIWEVIVYDEMNRVIQSALINSTKTRAEWQNEINTSPTVSSTHLGYYLWGEGRNIRPAASIISGYEIQAENYYDDYITLTATITPLHADNFSPNAISAHLVNGASAETYSQGPSTFGLLIANKTRVVKPSVEAASGLSGWTYSKLFYDSVGRSIYSVSINAFGGKDTFATQYNYEGSALTSISHTNNPMSTQKNVIERYRYVYEDFSGRLQKIQHMVNADVVWKDLQTFAYDDLGRSVSQIFGNNAESQTFSYNIKGALTGINERYALTGDKEGRNVRFGEALRYDYGFSKPRFDGNICGVVWRGVTRTQSSAYAYEYDLAGKMISGIFYSGNLTSNTVPTSWNNDVNNYSEYVKYDLGGNIEALQRWGKANSLSIPNNPIAIDRLVYNYLPQSNRLHTVIDSNTTSYGRGEFVNGSSQGYEYDASGNLIKDQSKNVTSIGYTYFNKPATVTFSNGNKIEYVYEANGRKVREYLVEGAVIKNIDYLANRVYEKNQLQFLSTPSGRTNLLNNQIKEEFYVKDHLGNVRAIIADVPSEIGGIGTMERNYVASYEPEQAQSEEILFEQVAELRTNKPATQSFADVNAGKLDASTSVVGTSLMLKVMAGDKVSINTDNFFSQLNSGNEDIVNHNNVLPQVLGTMGGSMGSLLVAEGGGSSNTLLSNTSSLVSAYEALQEAENDSSRPRSFLNFLFFDENMNFAPDQSRLWQADGADQWRNIGTDDYVEMNQSGFIVVYLSNESQNEVFFDNLTVSLQPGVLLEERHYYPYGLPIKGWGTTAVGSLNNRVRYQGNEYREELGLNWMDFGFRQYDPQLGRFLSLDPLADYGGQQTLSPYQAMGCNPANLVDPFGLKSQHPADPPKKNVVTPAGHFPTLHQHLPGGSHFGIWSAFYKEAFGRSNLRNVNEATAISNGTAVVAEVFGGGGYIVGMEGSLLNQYELNKSLQREFGSVNAHREQEGDRKAYDGYKKAKEAFSDIDMTEFDNFFRVLLPEYTITANASLFKKRQQQNGGTDWMDVNSFLKKSSTTAVALSDLYVSKHALSQMPKWLTGPYNRSIAMKGAKDYTSFMSIQMRRLGWQHGGRIIQRAGVPIMIGTTVIENAMYYDEIIKTNPPLDEVKDHYDTPWNPGFWIWMRIENQLKKLGPNKK